MRGWVFESIESCSNNNQMILKYIKNSVRALVNTIIKWNNNDAMKLGKRVRGYEFFYMYRAANNKNAHKKKKIIIIKWENAIENVYMVFNWTEDEEECGVSREMRKIE